MSARCALQTLGLIVIASFCAGLVQAADLMLQTPALQVEEGDLFQVSLSGSGFASGVDGGDFLLSWTPSLEFVDFAVEDPPWDLSFADDANAVETFLVAADVFSFSETPGQGGAAFAVATLVLRATTVGAASVFVSPSSVGWSLLGEPVEVTFGPAAELEIVPLPEPSTGLALWVGMGAIAQMRRRGTQAVR